VTCIMRIYEKPVLRDPVLIEGLPGIGLVANLATYHMIEELKADLFGEIFCSAFQDLAVSAKGGDFKFPTAKLYYHKNGDSQYDLIILHGNTQALTTRGQYELCWCILDTVEEMGCKRIITIGGYRPGRDVHEPTLYYAASDLEMALEARKLGAKILPGQIYGAAGLLIGLAKLHKMSGFCLLAETPGEYPDKVAALRILGVLSDFLRLNLDLDKNIVTDDVLAIQPLERKTRPRSRETPPEWFI